MSNYGCKLIHTKRWIYPSLIASLHLTFAIEMKNRIEFNFNSLSLTDTNRARRIEIAIDIFADKIH